MTLEMAPLVHPKTSFSLSSPLKGFISWISWRNTCSVHMLKRPPTSSSSIKEMENTSKQSLVAAQFLSMTVSHSLSWNTEGRNTRDWILTEALWPRAVLQGKIQVHLRNKAHWTIGMIVLYHLECFLLPKNICIYPLFNISSRCLEDYLCSQMTSLATGKSSHLGACLTISLKRFRRELAHIHVLD